MLYIFTTYLFFLKLAFMVTAGLILLSSFDDFFIDLFYVFHKTRRRFFIYSTYARADLKSLNSPHQKNFALMIPTWCEAQVIGPMLHNLMKSYDYDQYHVFVGTYPNDIDTAREVNNLMMVFDNLHRLTCPHPGPTNKADCLNHITRGIFTFEERMGMRFDGFILHDAEDIVHPLELKLYNHLIPRKDMIQIPVIPLERAWQDFTAGHYMDEFAESHTKELVVREALSGQVPSAGVGTALSRRAMYALMDNKDHKAFDDQSLTEDYDLGLRLKQKGLKQAFVRMHIKNYGLIATREYFPDTLGAAVRQKSRWLMGIVFQGWARQRWRGSWAMKYIYFRDRKAIFTAQLAMIAYFILFNILAVWLLEKLNPDGYRYPPLVRPDEPLALMLWITLFFMGVRLFNRALFTHQLYGLMAALLCLPRLFWGNVINFLATLRAILLYTSHLFSGKPLTWDKTEHTFPEERDLVLFRKRLGHILLEKNSTTQDNLDEALKIQIKTGQRLGEILIGLGALRQSALNKALRVQQEEMSDEQQT